MRSMMKTGLLFLVATGSAGYAADQDNLQYYWDFTTPPTATTTNPVRIDPAKSVNQIGINRFVDGTNSTVYHQTGGAFGGGYIAANAANAGYNNFHVYYGMESYINMTTGFSISMQVRNDKNASFNTSGVSFSMVFGSNDDATFRITNNAIALGGYTGSWTYTGAAGIVDNGASWQSVVLSVNGSGANAGIMSVYVDGNLFATSSAAFTSRMNGGVTKFAIGGKLADNYQETRTDASDLAFWNTALSAQEAAFLKDHAADQLGVIPEPATASLGLLGSLMLMLRRRRS